MFNLNWKQKLLARLAALPVAAGAGWLIGKYVQDNMDTIRLSANYALSQADIEAVRVDEEEIKILTLGGCVLTGTLIGKASEAAVHKLSN